MQKKTVLYYTEALYDKRKIILKHNDKIKIIRETRMNPYEWRTEYGKVMEDEVELIVITIPKEINIDFDELSKSLGRRKFDIGYKFYDKGHYTEVILSDMFTFWWELNKFEKAGMFKATQRVIPNKETGEFFPYYINAKRFYQKLYNFVFILLEELITWIKSTKNN